MSLYLYEKMTKCRQVVYKLLSFFFPELLIANSVVGDGVQIRYGQELQNISLSRNNTKCEIDVDIDIVSLFFLCK